MKQNKIEEILIESARNMGDALEKGDSSKEYWDAIAQAKSAIRTLLNEEIDKIPPVIDFYPNMVYKDDVKKAIEGCVNDND